MNNDFFLYLVPGGAMALVGIAAVFYWRRNSGIRYRWFLIGAGLWIIGVALKIGCALLTNAAVIEYLDATLLPPFSHIAAGLFSGVQSSLFEMGITLLAVITFRQLGTNSNRAIGIGIGAGACEAILLGVSLLGTYLLIAEGVPGMREAHEQIEKMAAQTPLLWLVMPVERLLALVCHAASRVLILRGTARRRGAMIAAGFLLFMLPDAVAGLFRISGWTEAVSLWWTELAVLPCAAAGIIILRSVVKRNSASLNSDSSFHQVETESDGRIT